MFIIPGTLEGLLGILLKDNAKYLPYSALNGVMFGGSVPAEAGIVALSRNASAAVVLVYVAAGLGVSWYLYLKRDAS